MKQEIHYMIPCGIEPANGIIQGIGCYEKRPVVTRKCLLKAGVLRGPKKGGDIGEICNIGIGYNIMLIIKVKGVGKGIDIDCRRDRCNQEEYLKSLHRTLSCYHSTSP